MASISHRGKSVRIIAGNLRGRKLSSIRGRAIRPTADRVREAIFNILGGRPVGAHVLDLFAGTGAMGLEALSRGATDAVFVDIAEPALEAIRKNIALCRLAHCTRVFQADILDDLRHLRPYRGVFDLIFIDPPYDRNMIQAPLAGLSANRLPSPDAMAVVEHAPTEEIQPLPPEWELIDQRRYGKTRLSFLRFAG